MTKGIQRIAEQLGMDSQQPWHFLIRKKAVKYEIFAFAHEPENPHLTGKWGAFLREQEGNTHGLGIYDSASRAIKACEFHECWSSEWMAPFIDQFP